MFSKAPSGSCKVTSAACKPLLRLAGFIFSLFFFKKKKEQVTERHQLAADLTGTSIVISKVTSCWFARLALSDWTSPLTNVQWNKSGRKPGKTKCLQPLVFPICYHSGTTTSWSTCIIAHCCSTVPSPLLWVLGRQFDRGLQTHTWFTEYRQFSFYFI